MSDVVSFVPPEPGAGPGTHQSRFETNPIARDRLPDGELSLTFKDVLDAINPLQQIPIVSWIYRAVTGDTISLPSRLAGGAILGGPVGVLLAGIQAGIEEMTGTDKEGGPMVALIRDVFGGSGDKATQSAAIPAAPEPAPETLNDVSPAANAAQPVPEARQIPRPQPVNIPFGWRSLPRAGGSLATPAAFDPGAIVLGDGAQSKAPAPETSVPASVSSAGSAGGAALPNIAPAAATPDWIASAMMRALDKYESAQRLKNDEAPAVSTVQ